MKNAFEFQEVDLMELVPAEMLDVDGGNCPTPSIKTHAIGAGIAVGGSILGGPIIGAIGAGAYWFGYYANC